jgi:tyrosyl-tRNA synthetase
MNTHELDKLLQNCSRIYLENKKYNATELILATQFAKSKSEARRLIANKAVQVNAEHITNDTLTTNLLVSTSNINHRERNI